MPTDTVVHVECDICHDPINHRDIRVKIDITNNTETISYTLCENIQCMLKWIVFILEKDSQKAEIV
jgi:hypothetical protein